MIFRFLRLMLYLSIFSISIFMNISIASKAISGEPTIVYYEHVPFIEAYKNQIPNTAVSSSNLLLVNKLSSQISIQFLPSARLSNKFKEVTDIAICALFKFKTSERALQYDFSLPVGFVLNNRFYVGQEKGALPRSLLNEQGEVKHISALFDYYPDAKLMLLGNISQGEFIDKAIKDIPEKNKIIISGLTSYTSLVKMISRSRADFAIMSPYAVTEFEHEADTLDLLSYRMQGVELISTIHMMCNKNKASTKILAMVDATLRALYQTPEFLLANTVNMSAKEAPLIIDVIEKVKGTH